jgi:hypothetical protein
MVRAISIANTTSTLRKALTASAFKAAAQSHRACGHRDGLLGQGE